MAIVSARSIELTDLRKGMPGITPAFGACLAEAATVCLVDKQHVSGVEMAISGDVATSISVRWEPIEDPGQAERCWADEQVAVEHGAYGVASLLVAELTPLTVVARSRKGTGFDYWLGDKAQSDGLFQNKARLEVSGIGRGGVGEMGARLERKRQQVTRSDATQLPAVVTIVEFSRPASHMATQ